MAEVRPLDSYTFFERVAGKHVPSNQFVGKTADDFAQWKKDTLPHVLKTLGRLPDAVPPRAELTVQWQENGLTTQRWLIDTQPDLAAVLWVMRRDDLSDCIRRPAILCCHGHTRIGKNAVMGFSQPGKYDQQIARENYDYGRKLAEAGFVTFTLDWLGFGERAASGRPNYRESLIRQRDECNLMYLCATMLGTTPLAINCRDALAATDFVHTLPFVDQSRLGVIGLSLGGAMATWLSLLDQRISATNVICYGGPLYHIGYRAYDICGSQVTPGLFSLVDVADLQGLIAPGPLLMEIGIHDENFYVDPSLNQNYRQLENIYRAAGAHTQLELDLFPGPHAWNGRLTEQFFRRHLRANW